MFHKDWAPYWQPNNKATKCSNEKCDTFFSILNRRHHCRKCGKIFCENCWGNLMFVKIYNKEVPVCFLCNEKTN